jgi:hypothetical protein
MVSLQEKIANLVNEYWNSNERPLLLSALGATLRQEFGEEELGRQMLGGKLRPFVEANLATKVRAINNPSNPMIWGLIPTGKSFNPDNWYAASREKAASNTPAVERPATQPRPALQARPAGRTSTRYDPELWRAFTDASSTGKRYVILAESVQYRCLTTDAAPPEGGIPVDPSDLPGSASNYEERIHNARLAIDAWAKKHSVDLNKYTSTISRVSKTLLELVLDAIPDSELQSTKLPLSIVKALMRSAP